MRKVPVLIAAASLAVGAVLSGAAIGMAGTSETVLPRCDRHPGVVDQGDDVEVRGHRWEPETTVTVTFDGEQADLTSTDDTATDTTPTSLEDRSGPGAGNEDASDSSSSADV